ncbi:Yae1-N domain-containing protein [Mycena venus]|uniref:Yae1-N domain-containing protein n=1 Tax=Mycena venus TaxID=2733690 RepID=A0A8H7CNT5_9AGAR|nr:Yae1-N domain-containing protein [Mycena venus]
MACADYLLEQENPAQPITVTPTSHVAFLVRLPEEIVDAITECMRYPIYPRFETTEAFLNEGRTGFSVARFSLSSFSKVCKALRMTVERMLYRDIHVDIIGWTRHGHSSEIQKHPMWPAACLRLFVAHTPEASRPRALRSKCGPSLGRLPTCRRATQISSFLSRITELIIFLGARNSASVFGVAEFAAYFIRCGTPGL